MSHSNDFILFCTDLSNERLLENEFFPSISNERICSILGVTFNNSFPKAPFIGVFFRKKRTLNNILYEVKMLVYLFLKFLLLVMDNCFSLNISNIFNLNSVFFGLSLDLVLMIFVSKHLSMFLIGRQALRAKIVKSLYDNNK